jgi:hypothetical protein
MDTEVSLPCSRKPITGLYPEPDESSQYPHPVLLQDCDSSVGIALGYGLDDRASRVRFSARAGDFSLIPPRSEWLRSPPSLLSNGYKGIFP